MDDLSDRDHEKEVMAAHIECPQPEGLTNDEKLDRTPEERRLEKRVLWKIDLIALTLISIMYFLASLVSLKFQS
jgi:hypothetical protein